MACEYSRHICSFLCLGIKIKISNIRQYQYFLLLLCSVKERNKRIFRGRNFRDELILIDGTFWI